MIDRIKAVSAVLFSLAGLLFPGAAMAAEAPDWVYDNIAFLQERGYIVSSANIADCSREELAKLVSQALAKLEDELNEQSAAVRYAQLSRLVLEDEAQCKLLKERHNIAQSEMRSAERKAAYSAELLARRSYQGENRTEVMGPLKARAVADGKAYEVAAANYARVRADYAIRVRALEKLKARQRELLGSIESDSEAILSDTSENIPWEKATELRAEFAPELEQDGFLEYENGQLTAHDGVGVKQVSDPRLKIDAEVRLDGGHSSGEEGAGSHSRLRTRVFGDYDIDGNWHAKGRVELEKYLSGHDRDHNESFDRYYLEGDFGAVHTSVGAFGSLMAEGNVYDSDFTGVRFSVGDPVTYSFELGKTDDVDKVWDFTASYDTPSYGVDVGYYNFDSINDVERRIAMANFRKPLGYFDFGAMLLRGWDRAAGNGTGYVFTLQHGSLGQDWKPRNAAWWLKYYYQPSSTYYIHTMNGMADYMNYDAAHERGGFKGWGIGYDYTIARNLILDLEYYRLKDLGTGKYSNTIWAALTTYLKNYKD